MPNHAPAVAVLIRDAQVAAAKHPDPFDLLVPFLKCAIDSNIDAYLLNAALVEAIAYTLARRIPLKRQPEVSTEVIRLLRERFTAHGTI